MTPASADDHRQRRRQALRRGEPGAVGDLHGPGQRRQLIGGDGRQPQHERDLGHRTSARTASRSAPPPPATTRSPRSAATLTVTPASLTITANDASKIYGAANPALSATYTGLVNGDSLHGGDGCQPQHERDLGQQRRHVRHRARRGECGQLHDHRGGRHADGDPGIADDHGERRQQDLRRCQPGAVGDVHRAGERRQLHGGDGRQPQHERRPRPATSAPTALRSARRVRATTRSRKSAAR